MLADATTPETSQCQHSGTPAGRVIRINKLIVANKSCGYVNEMMDA